jgi:hypothetical protein
LTPPIYYILFSKTLQNRGKTRERARGGEGEKKEKGKGLRMTN